MSGNTSGHVTQSLCHLANIILTIIQRKQDDNDNDMYLCMFVQFNARKERKGNTFQGRETGESLSLIP